MLLVDLPNVEPVVVGCQEQILTAELLVSLEFERDLSRSVDSSTRVTRKDQDDPLTCMKALSQNVSPTLMISSSLVTPKLKVAFWLSKASSLPTRSPVSELGSFNSARRSITRGPMASKRSDGPDVLVLSCVCQATISLKGGDLIYLSRLRFLPDKSPSDHLRYRPESSLQVFSRPRNSHRVSSTGQQILSA